jgi:multidrug efflux pump subunit AcrB
MALIGLLSLSGMLIRNGIVLVEEIEQQKQEKPQHEAIIYAATSRLRPILLTAFTTVLSWRRCCWTSSSRVWRWLSCSGWVLRPF